MPPLSALFADLPRQMLSDRAPVAGALILHKLNEEFILAWTPGRIVLDESWVNDEAPSVETLLIGTSLDTFRDFLPVTAEFLDGLGQLFVFLLSPWSLQTLDQFGVEGLVPSVKALDVGTA